MCLYIRLTVFLLNWFRVCFLVPCICEDIGDFLISPFYLSIYAIHHLCYFDIIPFQILDNTGLVSDHPFNSSFFRRTLFTPFFRSFSLVMVLMNVWFIYYKKRLSFPYSFRPRNIIFQMLWDYVAKGIDSLILYF